MGGGGRKAGRVKKVEKDTNNNSRLLLHMNKLNLNYQAIPRYSSAGIILPHNVDVTFLKPFTSDNKLISSCSY